MLYQQVDTQKRGHLDFQQFQAFVKILRRRPELEGIYEKLSTANGGKFDLSGFIKFMKECQKANFIVLHVSSRLNRAYSRRWAMLS